MPTEKFTYSSQDIYAEMTADAILALPNPNFQELLKSMQQCLMKLKEGCFARKQDLDWAYQHPIIFMYLTRLCYINHGGTIWSEYSAKDIPAELASDAMFAQSAPNMIALVNSLDRALTKLARPANPEWAWQHPIVMMYLNQLCHLNHFKTISHSKLTEYWDLCSK